jgi:ribosomal protein L37AE/L43A
MSVLRNIQGATILAYPPEKQGNVNMAKRSVKRMSISDSMQKFSTESKCHEYLVNTRWKDGFVCPKCGSKRHCKLSNGLFQCIECHHQTSATAVTFMHRSHVPLVKWFLARYFITQDKRGISATQLPFAIGVNYKTAWFIAKEDPCCYGTTQCQAHAQWCSGI